MSNADVVRVNVARDYTKLPGGRSKNLGSYSGEDFRERYLIPPLTNGKNLIVELDGVRGYGSSFLEEAFGGAVRALQLHKSEALQRIQVETKMKSRKIAVEKYMADAAS